ncbi:hypothetical protein MCOR25_008765 [Pyricularia grisea]|nr:hypothetical protein MCOR25_008765 [Pyricularia grisea]
MPGNAPDERSPLLGTAQGHQLDDTLANAKPAVAVVDETLAPLAAAHTYDDAEDPGGNDQDRRNESETGKLSSAAILRVVVVLLVGAFMANLDGSLVLATHPVIASEFNALSLSSWLFVSFNLAGASTQAVVCIIFIFLSH